MSQELMLKILKKHKGNWVHVKDLAKESGAERKKISTYMHRLLKYGLVRRHSPYEKRDVYWRIDDEINS